MDGGKANVVQRPRRRAVALVAYHGSDCVGCGTTCDDLRGATLKAANRRIAGQAILEREQRIH